MCKVRLSYEANFLHSSLSELDDSLLVPCKTLDHPHNAMHSVLQLDLYKLDGRTQFMAENHLCEHFLPPGLPLLSIHLSCSRMRQEHAMISETVTHL